MTYEEITSKVKELIQARAKKNCCNIQCGKNLKEEYGIDSIAVTELVFDIEDAFQITFESSALAFDNLATVEKISDYVKSRLS